MLNGNKTFSMLPNKYKWHKNFDNSDTDDIEVVYNIRNVPYIQLFFFFFMFGYMSHILRTSTEHKTASLAEEGNSAYFPV